MPLKTVEDVRAALRAGHGFPGDRDAFEADLRQALEASSEDRPKLVNALIVDHLGRIRLRQDPGFDTAVEEGVELSTQLEVKARGAGRRERGDEW